jgi:crotonobetainyl-CoA:carnitine CoA-transferase CaiB-like acyl-CoA transferase
MVAVLVVMSLFLGGREMYSMAFPEPESPSYCARYESVTTSDGRTALVCVTQPQEAQS